MEIALDPKREVMLAYEMNGEDLSPTHGYPVRLVCPGLVGVRWCKWVGKIIVSNEEADHGV
jgi:sulfite oxidase